MGMPRLRHVPATLFLTMTSLLAAACARAPSPAEAPATAYPEGERRPSQAYGQPSSADAVPTATATAPSTGGLPTFAEPPATDIVGLQAQLDVAERSIGLVLDLRAGGDAAQAPANAPPASPVSTDPCLVACAALASMRRSADHLCGMAGESDAACGGARERVQRAEQRVLRACPACAGK